MAEQDAKRFRQFVEGMTDFAIAKEELDAEGWQTLAATKREYNQEVKTRANSILVSRKRWVEYVTKLHERQSPKSDK